MKILVIGGTRFLGRHLVNVVQARGHEVTLFNRGKTNPDLFPQVETIIGDREKNLDKLSSRQWDAVIDTCGYVPRMVKISAEALKNSVGQYVFISSISIYADFTKVGIDENDPVGKIEDETLEEITGEAYGPLKALCETAIQEIYRNGALIIRPGLIVGPYDMTDRFTYWPVRVARGGDVLVPEKPDVPIQFIDVLDLSDFITKLIENKTSGIYNATGPDYQLTLGTLLETCKRVSYSDANFKWANIEFLNQNNVTPWSDMPVWVPSNEENAGFSRVDISKAIKSGLKFRPLAETVKDTLAWANTRPPDHEWNAGLKPERESELLKLLEYAQ
ncbi:MAG: SDR family oxidoreductase [Anaerolineales bacterium]